MWFCQFPAFIFFCDTFFLRLTSSFGHKRRDGFALLFFRRFVRAYGFRFEEFESCHPNYGELFLPTKSCEVCVCMIKQCFTLGGIIYPTNLYVFTMHGVFALSNPVDSLCFITIHINILQLYILVSWYVCFAHQWQISIINVLCLAYFRVYRSAARNSIVHVSQFQKHACM